MDENTDDWAAQLVMSTVVCRTEQCENADIEITLPCGDEVICGACGHEITDITPT